MIMGNITADREGTGCLTFHNVAGPDPPACGKEHSMSKVAAKKVLASLHAGIASSVTNALSDTGLTSNALNAGIGP